jgi:hypothetical protein
MTASAHPAWCAPSRCGAGVQGGAHEGTPSRVTTRRRRNEPPRMLMLLLQRPGELARLRIVVITDSLVNSTDLDLDTAALAAATITGLIEQAAA